MKKHMLKETNDMRRLMGLDLLNEEVNEETVVNEEMESAGKEDKKESGDLNEEDKTIGVDAPEKKSTLKQDEEDHGDVVNEGEAKLPSMDEMKKCVSEGMSKKAVCEKYSKCDEGKIIEMYEQCKKMNEDSEGEETYHYGEDEGKDHKEEMSMEDHISAIEDHLKHLKKDMGYDEDHEDRDEKGTHFAEGKKYSEVLNTLTESEYKKLKEFIK